MVQYHMARKHSTGRPSRIPDTVIRCAATVPASRVPAAIRTARRAVATSPLASRESSGIESASATSCNDGPKLIRPWDNRRSSNSAGGFPKPITSKSNPGGSRCERSANSLIVRLSSRRWIEVSTSGTASVMNPGLLPVLWIEVPPRSHAPSTLQVRKRCSLKTRWSMPLRLPPLHGNAHPAGG